MKAGKLAIRLWLVCQYNKYTLVDLPSSLGTVKCAFQKMPSSKVILS